MSIKYFKNGKLIDLASLGGGVSDLIDIFWPIGSYYETSDSNFDPNESWRAENGYKIQLDKF